MSDSLYSYVLYSPLNSPGQNTGMGSCSHHQQIFWTQGLNPGLLHCRLILYQLGYWGSPWTLEWVAYPFSRGYSWPRNWTGVSCISGGFFTSWATREAHSPFSTQEPETLFPYKSCILFCSRPLYQTTYCILSFVYSCMCKLRASNKGFPWWSSG